LDRVVGFLATVGSEELLRPCSDSVFPDYRILFKSGEYHILRIMTQSPFHVVCGNGCVEAAEESRHIGRGLIPYPGSPTYWI
jgi:hypothetical protein